MSKSTPYPEDERMSGGIVEAALRLGADVAGVAPVERFVLEDAGSYRPTGYRPEELLPGAQSVIVVAVSVLDGVLSSNLEPVDTTYAFGNFGYVHVNRELNNLTYAIARQLERQGWASLPLGACGSTRLDRAAYEEGRTVGPLAGIFNLKRAAVLSGVGRRARSGVVATVRYGTRVRLGAVISTAQLSGSPLLEGTPCPADCRLCVNACPMGAIESEGVVNHVKCYSDKGRRGRTEAETLEEMAKATPSRGAVAGYLPHEHSAIDGFGNRMCRVACVAVCPLWRNAVRTH